jgi:hypothetical protein
VTNSGLLTTGILVRHQNQDADIGQDKAETPKKRPNHVRADDRVSAPPRNIIMTILADSTEATQHDLMIYAAASAAVTSRLEYGRYPPGHDARQAAAHRLDHVAQPRHATMG